MFKWRVVGSSVALRALANCNRQFSRPWLNCSIHYRVSEWKPPAHPALKGNSLWHPADKVHFYAKNTLCQHLSAAEGAFGKPFFFWSKWAHFGHYLPYYGSPKSRKLLGNPPKKPKMRQNHPKMGFGGILDRLEAISIPSLSISKGIKNKNFDRFWATMSL